MDRKIFGVLIVMVGVILLLENVGPGVGIRDISFARLWPVVLIVYGAAAMLRNRRDSSDLFVGGLIALLGVIFLAETMFGIDLWAEVGRVARNLWPVALIAFGAYLMLRGKE